MNSFRSLDSFISPYVPISAFLPLNFLSVIPLSSHVLCISASGRITDINDYPLWEKVFRTKTGSSSHTGKSYSVGSASKIYDLPIMDGSHPTQGDRGALKTGYAFKFTIDTVGEYFEDEDYIRIVPTFYYVGKNGGSGSPVDIYYNEYFNGKDNILVRIGSDNDKTNRQVIVNTDIYRNIPLPFVVNFQSDEPLPVSPPASLPPWFVSAYTGNSSINSIMNIGKIVVTILFNFIDLT